MNEALKVKYGVTSFVVVRVAGRKFFFRDTAAEFQEVNSASCMSRENKEVRKAQEAGTRSIPPKETYGRTSRLVADPAAAVVTVGKAKQR